MSNNKPRNIQPDTKADGDGSINTKKGFLLSFPGKKKGEEAASGIVPAKTINGDAAKQPQKNGAPSQNKNDMRQQSGNDKNNQKNSGNTNGNGGARPQKNKKNRPEGQQNQPARQENEQPSQNSKNAQSQKNRKQHNKPHRQNSEQKNSQNEQPQNNQHQNNGKKNGNNKNDQRHGDRNSGNNNNNNGNGRRNNRDQRQKSQLPGLSPLSKDMMSFSKMSKADAESISQIRTGEKEPSLEEKYKNAVPLADQIAAEEEKRRVKPRAMRTHKIDRPSTANVLLNEVSADGENVEQPKITDREYEVVGIRFREAGKIYYFDPAGEDIPYGTPVIVETARGAEYGYTAISNRLVPHTSVVPPLKKIKRIANKNDTEKYLANKALEADAEKIFKQKVAALGLEMNLVFVEYTFDNSKLLFYFTAESRIDFRELVKELASVFRTRIELRQIGVRDEAKMIGGIGVCGRGVCCNSFLGDFAQVSIKMAKDQGLSLNSAKISGTCGKLMCCLRYEDKVYEEEMARTPKVGSIVETSDGRGVVTEAHALKGTVKVTLDSAPDSPAKLFDREDVKVVGFNKAAVKEDAEEMKELKALEDNN